MSIYAGALFPEGHRTLSPHPSDPPATRTSGPAPRPWETLAAKRQLAEDALIDQAVAGDDSAFVALYDRHYDRVFRHVYYRVSGWHDAQDVTQEVFLRAWRAIGRYRKTGTPFIAWLLVIAHNTAVSYFRRSHRERSVDPEIEDWALEDGFEGRAEARADHERVRLSLRRLPPEQQTVLAMRFFEDLSHRDIAAALGKTEGHVRVIQHRALGKLRRLLDEGVT